MNKQTMNKQTSSNQLIESIERDPSTSFWLLDQVRRIDERDICDLMRDVDMLKQVLDLKWGEALRSVDGNDDTFWHTLWAGELRAEQAKMVDDFLAGKCEHPI
jgi:hypothetical protein